MVVHKDYLNKIKESILPVLVRNHVKRAGVFGSLARGEARADSDIDLLVELADDASLFDFVGLKFQLEDVVGRPVDLVEYDAIKPLIRSQILKEQLVIL